jgi:peptide chain release factor 1
MDPGLLKKWEASASRYDELTSQLMDPSVISQPALLVRLTKERTELEAVALLFQRYQEIHKQLDEAAHLLADSSAEAELHSLATEETAQLETEREELERRVLEHLTPKDPRDEKNLFLEIRAGTGGDEAALFAGDLLRMYTKFAERHKLKVDLVEASETGKGGYKTVIAVIEGKGGYGLFKYESGVHRVQRVPVTEAAGRIHTSTVTVAVMPEVDG